MSEPTLLARTVNHVAIDIAASPDIVWRAIVDEYVEARKFRDLGFVIEPVDTSAVAHAGYRMRLERGGVLLDERILYVTERDDTARRLSVFVDYVSRLDGITHVNATYHARQTVDGARYSIDCHASVGIEPPATATAKRVQFDKDLIEYLEEIKAKIEGA